MDFCSIPFARSKFKSPEVYPTHFSLDKSAVIAFCQSIELRRRTPLWLRDQRFALLALE